MRAYIAAPFRMEATDIPGRAYGTVDDDSYAAFLERMERALIDCGWSTCLPHRDKGRWGQIYLEPEVLTRLCFDEIAAADVVVAMPGRSRGVHLELGYAVGLGRPLVLCLPEGEVESTLLPGLHNEAQVHIIRYDSPDSLMRDLGHLAANWTQEIRSRPESRKVAVIDVGSNSVKLLVSEAFEDGQLRAHKRLSMSDARLAEGMQDTGILQADSIRRTVSAITRAVRVAESERADAISVVATGAVREAANAAEFIQLVREESGCDMVVLSGEDEARTLYLGLAKDLPDDRRYLAINIGGSSTELIYGDHEHVLRTFHLGLGALTLSEACLLSDPVADADHEALLDVVASAAHKLDLPRLAENDLLLHTGGELDYVLACGCPVERANLGASHPVFVKTSDFALFADTLRSMPRSVLHAMMPSNPRWMDGAIACNAIALTVARLVGSEAIVPSNRNLADGLAIQTVGRALT